MMIKCTAFVLRCWWWLYYAAWNAGEWIFDNPGWLTRHTFHMLIFVNLPVVMGIFLDTGADAPAPIEHSPLAMVDQMAQALIHMTPVIFMADKIIIVALVLTWVAHLALSLLKE